MSTRCRRITSGHAHPAPGRDHSMSQLSRAVLGDATQARPRAEGSGKTVVTRVQRLAGLPA